MITAKCYVASVIDEVAMTSSNGQRMLVLKYIRGDQVKDASVQASELIDKWIHLAPTTPHIVKAYDVLEEYNDVHL